MSRLLLVASLVSFAAAGTACKQEGTVTVRNLDFRGLQAVDAGRLRNALATKQSSKLPWGRQNYFDRSRFDADLKRIEAFYADRGYPDARVTGFDVKLSEEQDAVDVTLTIAEGEPVLIAAVNFDGFEVIPPDHLSDLQERMPLSLGERRDRQEVVGTHEMAVNELRDHGYPYAKVATAENGGPDGKSAVVTFKAEPGPLAHFGPIEVAGNQSVAARVIERQVTYKPGDLYRRTVVQDTQRRLYAMELFQFVNVESLNPEQQNAEVRTRVTVAEGSHQRVNFGVGYGTEEHGRVDGEYHHVNFLGGARVAGAHARYSSLDRGVRLDFNQPYFLNPRMSLGAEGQQWYTYTPAYRSVVSGGKTTLTHKLTPQLSWAFSMTSERTVSSISPEVQDDPTLRDDLIALGLDPDTLEQRGTLSAFGFDLQRSTADNVLNARRGYQLALHAEAAGKYLPGTYNYTAASVDGRHYIPISERFVIANRVQLGNIAAGDDPAQVPFAKKYFLGGAGSIRGWGRYEISPLSRSGLPVGGNTLFAFSSEARLVLRGNLGGVLFVDGGNVWADDWTIDLSDLRYAIGPGLRYQTPIGPVRFDLGYQVNPIEGLTINGEPQKRRWRIHFSIGQAF
ncbi:MAG: outer membrane protein assembly factor BamA [Luteitalea sp.]|nr:outer membrane protein assembly factor BamA [Luteitalea sp.]